MLITDAALSALVNIVVLAGIPFFFYFAFQRWHRKRGFKEITQRVGLQLGEVRYIGYGLVVALGIVAYFVFWPPSAEPFIREGSAQSKFDGLGFNTTTLTMAILYGVIATGFCEELLFRGMIAGSLSRRLPILWANLVQATIFLLPHLLLLLIMPEIWPILFLIFAGGLLKGWLRIKSGSILGPWLIHATANVAMRLNVAIQTATCNHIRLLTGIDGERPAPKKTPALRCGKPQDTAFSAGWSISKSASVAESVRDAM